MRRTLTIAAIAIVVAGLLFLGYYYFFANTGSGITVENGAPTQTPFGTPGQNAPAPTGSDTTSGTSSTIAGTQVAPHLIMITSSPVAHGFLVLDAATTSPATSATSTPSSGTSVRYIDRTSGNMYAYNVTEGTSVRLTNHTAPGVEEAAWVADGSLAFIRFLTSDTDKSEHIDTYALPADGTDGRLLARDLSEVLTQGNTLFTFMPSTSGSVGTVSKTDGSAAATLFTTALASLQFSFAGTNLFAYTKPSAQTNGYAFLVDRKSGAFAKIVGPLSGFAALPSPSGAQLLVSYLNNGVLTLALFDAKTHAFTTLPVATLAEKCVWAPDGQSAYCGVPTALSVQNLPDSWYQGTVAFSDRLWKIDLVARAATLVANLPELTKTPVDATSLTIDKNENTLVFMNKRDGSLWAYSF